jgi:hypothetical protein
MVDSSQNLEQVSKKEVEKSECCCKSIEFWSMSLQLTSKRDPLSCASSVIPWVKFGATNDAKEIRRYDFKFIAISPLGNGLNLGLFNQVNCFNYLSQVGPWLGIVPYHRLVCGIDQKSEPVPVPATTFLLYHFKSSAILLARSQQSYLSGCYARSYSF